MAEIKVTDSVKVTRSMDNDDAVLVGRQGTVLNIHGDGSEPFSYLVDFGYAARNVDRSQIELIEREWTLVIAKDGTEKLYDRHGESHDPSFKTIVPYKTIDNR